LSRETAIRFVSAFSRETPRVKRLFSRARDNGPVPGQMPPGLRNPSYDSKTELWHAVAMQQQRLGSLGLRSRPSLGRTEHVGSAVTPARSTQAAARGGGEEASLTLAQRIGLVEAPEPPLTAEAWQVVCELSLARARCGGEASRCSICLCPLGGKEQVRPLSASEMSSPSPAQPSPSPQGAAVLLPRFPP